MARKAKELGVLAVKNLKEPGLYAVGGVAGLTLQIAEGGSKSWLLRYSMGPKRRALGLGGFPTISLAAAREAARDARAKLLAGTDPIDEKKAVRSALVASKAKAMTFKECAETYITKFESSFRNAKHRAQWPSTMKKYVYPTIGNLLVGDVEHTHVIDVLDHIWNENKNYETAKRVRSRIQAILDWATVMGYRKGDNPARWHGFLSKVFVKPNDATVKHHPALPFSEMADFMLHLREIDGIGARALEFAILTAARSGEVRGAMWDEIDIQKAMWTVPAARMKAGKEHRVSLSTAALKLLGALPRMAGTDLVFPAPRGGQLSDMTLAAVIKRMHAAQIENGLKGYMDPKRNRVATPHGTARSTFRTWGSEETDYPREVLERALVHTIADKVEASYDRGDLWRKRISLMEDWATFCTGNSIQAS